MSKTVRISLEGSHLNMLNTLVLVKELVQVSNYVFKIVWSDEKTSSFRLSDLQKKCPCARCQDTSSKNSIHEEIRAIKICSVGNYALRIDFESGCSRGVFTFCFLRQLSLGEL